MARESALSTRPLSAGASMPQAPSTVARAARSAGGRLFGGPELVRERIFIGPRQVADAIPRSPQAHLMVQRNDGRVVDRELGRALQQRLALDIVHGDQRVLEDRVNLDVRIMA